MGHPTAGRVAPGFWLAAGFGICLNIAKSSLEATLSNPANKLAFIAFSMFFLVSSEDFIDRICWAELSKLNRDHIMSEEAQIASKAEFAHLCNVTPGRVSQWLAEGKTSPASIVGGGRHARINVQLAQADLRGALDEAMARNEATGGTRLEMSAELHRIEPDPILTVEEYRNRSNLPNDFARGTLYGAHAVAYHVPYTAAFALFLAGLDHKAQIKVHHQERDAAHFPVHDVTVTLGLEGEDQEEPTAFSPTRFMGYGPGGSTG